MTNILKRKLSVSIMGAAVPAAGLAAALFVASSHAQPSSPAAACSLSTLKGMYAATQSGSSIDANARVPHATAAAYVFDGSGKVHGITTRSVNGKISPNLKFDGTYTLENSCTGSETIKDSTGAVRRYNLVTVPSGNLFTFIRTDDGTVLVGSGRRG